MKFIYKSPAIKVEELIGRDVLCSSTDPAKFDNRILSGNKSGAQGIFDLRDIDIL